MPNDRVAPIRSVSGRLLNEVARQQGGDPSHTHSCLIARAKIMRAEIAQIFADADHWNATHTPWKEAVNPDPDGELKRLADNLDVMLSTEPERCERPTMLAEVSAIFRDAENQHSQLQEQT